MKRDNALLPHEAAILLRGGWHRRVSDPLWGHDTLAFPWPGRVALRLERERLEQRRDALALFGESPTAKKPRRQPCLSGK